MIRKLPKLIVYCAICSRDLILEYDMEGLRSYKHPKSNCRFSESRIILKGIME